MIVGKSEKLAVSVFKLRTNSDNLYAAAYWVIDELENNKQVSPLSTGSGL